MALWRVRATVDDRPGYLSVLTASLALRSVNILAVQVHTTEAGAVDDFLVDAPDAMTEAELTAAVQRGRGRDAFVTRAAAHGLADQPTRVLALAARLVHDPDALGEALAALLDAAQVRWRPEPAGTGYAGARMCLDDPAGGSYEVTRPAPAFTPAEYARAQALAEVAAGVQRRVAEPRALLLADGAELTVRTAVPEDVAAVRAMHGRASAATRAGRYPGRPGVPDDARLLRLVAPARGVTLLACAGDRVVAVASLVVEGAVGEVAVLVEDAWQRRGVGTALLRRLRRLAEQGGLVALVGHADAGAAAVPGVLRRLGVPGRVDRDGGVLSVTLALPGSAAPADGAPVTR